MNPDDSLPFPLDPVETKTAFEVALYARSVVEDLIERGRPNAHSFMSLCAALQELELTVIGGSVEDRYEDIHKLVLQKKTRDECANP